MDGQTIPDVLKLRKGWRPLGVQLSMDTTLSSLCMKA